MKFVNTPLAGLTIVQTQPHTDARGRFVRVYCEEEFFVLRPRLRFMQVNLSLTRGRGSVRGLHFQRPPAAEAKLIRCLRGAVFDVALDLRAGSATYLQWHAVELDETAQRQVFIPEGFAHGFQALSDEAELLYQHTAPYRPDCEGGVRFDDARLDIRWPLTPVNVSPRDRSFAAIDTGFEAIAL